MKLLEPYQLGDLDLQNRLVMAPLTRLRAGEGNAPTDLNAEYYGQRASFGLIVSEATPVMVEGHGYPDTPGIYTAEQVEGWKKVTEAVHANGGKIFCQLWHCGRISRSEYQPDGQSPPSASAVAAEGAEIMHPETWESAPAPVPHAMTIEEIKSTVEAYAQAIKNCQEAGFDGVEIHGANGYLINQFLADNVNQREDEYGGSIENRARFLFEVLDATAPLWPGRVALRLSPPGTFSDIHESDGMKTYRYVVNKLNDYDITYLHLVEPRMWEDSDPETYQMHLSSADMRPLYKGALISAGGHTKETAEALVQSGQAELIAFGRDAISNPDLAERLAQGAELNPYNRDTFYGGGAEGYTDYPFLETASQTQ